MNRSYYYDRETKLYYLNSRYYNQSVEEHTNYKENLLFNNYPENYCNQVKSLNGIGLLKYLTISKDEEFNETIFVGVSFEFHLVYGFHFSIGIEITNESIKLY